MNSIEVYRKKMKLSQAELANLLGVTQSAVAKWETGESRPRANKLPELARIFKCSIDALFNDTE